MVIPDQPSPTPLAGQPRRRAARGRARVLRGGALRAALPWLCWWALLMALWVMLDDSFRLDELIAGAVASALAAMLATAVSGGAVKGGAVPGGAAARAIVGTGWLRAAAGLPWQVLRDTWVVYGALGRMARGGPPPGGYTEIPVRHGDGSTPGVVRRVLLTWARSLAPNTFVVGIDPDRDVMIIHRLVAPPEARVPARRRDEA